MLAHTDYTVSLNCTNKTSQTEFNQTNRGTTPWAALRKLQRAVALYILLKPSKNSESSWNGTLHLQLKKKGSIALLQNLQKQMLGNCNPVPNAKPSLQKYCKDDITVNQYMCWKKIQRERTPTWTQKLYFTRIVILRQTDGDRQTERKRESVKR